MRTKYAATIAIILILILAVGRTVLRYPVQPHYTIAILTQNRSSFCDEILEGIVSHCNKSSISITVYNADNDPLVLRSQAEHVFDTYDIVLAIAAKAAQHARAVQRQRKHTTPLIFIGVRDPVTVGLIESETSPDAFCTGITLDVLPLTTASKVLQQTIPHAKKVLIPYHPESNAGMSEKEAYAVEKDLSEQQIMSTLVPVKTAHDAVHAVKSLITNHDSILLLTDAVVTDAIHGIISIANTYNVPVVSFNLASIEAGAHAAWGGHYKDIGIQAGILTEKILENNKVLPPVERIANWHTVIQK